MSIKRIHLCFLVLKDNCLLLWSEKVGLVGKNEGVFANFKNKMGLKCPLTVERLVQDLHAIEISNSIEPSVSEKPF